MPHDHALPGGAAGGDRRVLAALAVNLLLTLAQIVAGVVSGSLALIADAIHNLSDALSLGIALVARRIGRRPADADMTFGYGRAEVVAALANYVTLIVIAVYLAAEGLRRLIDPPGVEGWIVVAVAGVALVVDIVTVLLVRTLARGSANMRAALLHNLADAAGSVAVIGAGTLILLYDWRLVDPLVTLGISAYILIHAGREVLPVVRILMLGTPPGQDPHAVAAAMAGIDGVAGVHHLHLWQMQEHEPSLEAHVVLADGADARAVKAAMKALLSGRFGIGHSVLELETEDDRCAEAATIGHDTAAPDA